MCLILFAYRAHPRYHLILAANRDEYYNRPTATAGFWSDSPYVLGGRDLHNMGTWLGITHTGRFAALTNYRNPRSVMADARSRGELVKDFLTCRQSPPVYLKKVSQEQHLYNGFNLLIGDDTSLWYFGKQEGLARELGPGIYGLSNHLINTPWPKVSKGIRSLRGILAAANSETVVDTKNLFVLLHDSTPAAEKDLPDTGVSRDWERILSPIFVCSPEYGTRCSTVLLIGVNGVVEFTERTYLSYDQSIDKTENGCDVFFSFQLMENSY